ncbi:hypothetical protein C8A00DRAFT_35142 [Chaetomidium leptoderma]|uniref:Uncharacterized protein n=1 Tax=Chaetomidium leptoderma TaxID=669021 RepID=A0AAN6VIJ1_9PEZI|nr:hypothetical protein C8A00DRAFT_35142 [Chaetomidium leptoderma]
MANMAQPTMTQPTAPSTSNTRMMDLARVMLGNPANSNGGGDVESFAKGFETGFGAGWALGFEQGKNQAQCEGEAEDEEPFGAMIDEFIESILPARLNNNAKVARDAPSPPTGCRRCLLSDADLVVDVSDSSSIKEEDVFYDAASIVTAALGGDLPDDLDGASSRVAASGFGPSEGNTNASTTPTVRETNIASPASSIPPEEDLVDLSYDDEQPVVAPSPDSNESDTTLGGRAVAPGPDPTPPTTLYGIPLAHTIRPITPDFTITPQATRPRPAYPKLSGRYDIYALAAEGKTVVEDPYRVLIGPASASARAAWKGDNGKWYVRNKLNGGYRKYHGGSSRKNDHADDHPRDRAGVAWCNMVRDDDHVWYILAMFDTQQKAREAEEFFRGYACGGSIMWGWVYQIEE